MKIRPLTIETQNAFEANVGRWGPLALHSESLRRFWADWEAPDTGAVDAFSSALFVGASAAPVTIEQVGDHVYGEGYLRVASVAGRGLAKGQKVAVIPIAGPVIPTVAPAWMREYGIRVASLPNIVGAARAAANDAQVGRIIYAVHSPGGSAFGVSEAAAQLRKVSEAKPTTAAVNYLSASAAYWLSATANEIVAEASSLVGSVGVRVSHVDVSKALENEGVTVTELSMPASKTDLSPYKPLSDTARAELMAVVSEEYQRFAADISQARRVDMAAVGEQYGRVHSAARAKSIGLVDRIASFEALLGESATTTDLTAHRRAEATLRHIKRK